MSRTVVGRRMVQGGMYYASDTPASAGATPDTYQERLVKYIPGEVVALYLALTSIASSNGGHHAKLPWIIFAFCLIATPLYLWRIGKEGKTPSPAPSWIQLAISTFAFFIWAFAIGGAPFATLPWYNSNNEQGHLIGALLLPTYTFLIALVQP